MAKKQAAPAGKPAKKPAKKRQAPQNRLGTVQADCTKNARSRSVIEHGFIRGTGPLAEVIERIHALEAAAIEYGFNEDNFAPLRKARWELFETLEGLDSKIPPES